MSSLHRKRAVLVILLISGVSLSLALILYALSQNIHVFYTPSQLLSEEMKDKRNTAVRIGGMVVKGSVVRKEGLEVEFMITDFNQQMKVAYTGILPDLFKEGQGVVAFGRREGMDFKASQVLAKHDEKYMPPEIANLMPKGET